MNAQDTLNQELATNLLEVFDDLETWVESMHTVPDEYIGLVGRVDEDVHIRTLGLMQQREDEHYARLGALYVLRKRAEQRLNLTQALEFTEKMDEVEAEVARVANEIEAFILCRSEWHRAVKLPWRRAAYMRAVEIAFPTA